MKIIRGNSYMIYRNVFCVTTETEEKKERCLVSQEVSEEWEGGGESFEESFE